jgi:hypothetical protein
VSNLLPSITYHLLTVNPSDIFHFRKPSICAKTLAISWSAIQAHQVYIDHKGDQ